MANVSFIKKDLRPFLKIFGQIADCVKGEKWVKDRKTDYLPQPNASDQSLENQERYLAYLNRAVFYGVTGRTLSGLVGQVFSRKGILELPPELQVMEDDANGEGVSLEQSVKRATGLVMAFGRAGLYTDYPTTEATTTKADLATGDVRPVINLYQPDHIINWRTTTRGAKTLLSLVVLKERYIASDDSFEAIMETRYRVLRLEDNVYTVEIFEGEGGTSTSTGITTPLDSAGSPFTKIPFTFIGAENNDSKIDDPPLYDLSTLNIAHYRNSADYEESSFIVGQPTPYFSGLTQAWVDEVFDGGTVQLGSRAAVPLPEGGGAGLLQASANTMPMEAMKHKEAQMIALGAKLIEGNTTQITATQAGIESASETSILSSSANNVSAAYTKALEFAAMFTGSAGEIKLELNTDFDFSTMSAQEQQQLVATWQSGAISFTEMRDNLRSAGIANQEDDAAEEEIEEGMKDAPNLTGEDGE